jgi:hypothetical protein
MDNHAKNQSRKPDALKGARPVWGEGCGNGRIERPAPRRVPTPQFEGMHFMMLGQSGSGKVRHATA